MSSAHQEIAASQRFAFGENWQGFLAALTPETITKAESSLREMLGADDLSGRSFLDVGSGSGLFSLAAHRLGARVVSFDFDEASVWCTEELRHRFADPNGAPWDIHQGSILDAAFVSRLGRHDVVYSWGVLHHTGDMWRALELTASLVAPDGALYIAIYNDQGTASRLWAAVKRRYNSSGALVRRVILTTVWLRFELQRLVVAGLKRSLRLPSQPTHRSDRGMNRRTDLLDWVGGWPFEVAKPEEVHDALRAGGFTLVRMTTCRGYGCNEFVLRRVATDLCLRRS